MSRVHTFFKFVTLKKKLILFVFRNFAVLLHDREAEDAPRRVKRNQITQARAHDVNKIFLKNIIDEMNFISSC